MTGRFTTRTDAAVDRFVQGQLDIVVDGLVGLMGDDLVAVVLAGGFGRGEGSVRVENDGQMHVVNDYDIEVVYRERWGARLSKVLMHLRYSRALIALADRLAGQLAIKQVDLCLRGGSSYAACTAPRLADYDLRCGHVLLWGEQNPVLQMPAWQSHQIPLFEGTWLLRNRAIGLLLARFYLTGGGLSVDKTEYFYIEISKAILAMGDALFIARQCYVHSYAERAGRFPDLLDSGVPDAAAIGALYRQAAAYKLSPPEQYYPDVEPVELWDRVVQLYVRFFLYYESVRTQVEAASIHDYAARLPAQFIPSMNQRLRLLFDRMRGAIEPDAQSLAALKTDKPRTVALALALLSAWQDGKIVAGPVETACLLAGVAPAKADPEADWYQLTRSFLLLIHPKGELGRALRVGV